ncbi:MAG: hypothetical protein ABNH53_07740 [Henriciella sp.]|jgi:hypothetical protein
MPAVLAEQSDKFKGRVWNGDPYIELDIPYWSKMAFWTVVEFGCLSCGYSPVPLLEAPDEAVQAQDEQFKTVSDRIRLIQRAVIAGDLPNQIDPYDGIQWLLHLDEPFPDSFQDTCKKRSHSGYVEPVGAARMNLGDIVKSVDALGQKIDQSVGSNSASQTKKINSLQKLLLAMAAHKYGYDVYDPKSGIAGAIRSSLGLVGHDLDETTIRRHLDDAAEKHWK